MQPLHDLQSLLDLPWVTWAVAAVLLAVVLVLIGLGVRRRMAPYRLHRRLRKLGHAVLRNVLIEDGIDGKTSIDYLILRPEGVLVLELKPYRGIIFGGKGIDHWTQVVGTRSFKFPNPLHKHENDLLAVKAAAPAAAVFGRLVFTGGSEFPKGTPEGVISLDALFAEFGGTPVAPVGEELCAAWARLKAAAVPVRGRIAAGESLDPAPKRSHTRWYGWLLAGFATGWIAWRLIA